MRELVLPVVALVVLAFSGSAIACPYMKETTAQIPLETVSNEKPLQTPKPQS